MMRSEALITDDSGFDSVARPGERLLVPARFLVSSALFFSAYGWVGGVIIVETKG